MDSLLNSAQRIPWNKDKLVGQKPALKLKEIWEICIRLQMENNIHELALFNVAIDSKLRGCDLVQLKVNDIMRNGKIMSRAVVVQQKTHKPVPFEITEQSRESLFDLINDKQLGCHDYLLKSRLAELLVYLFWMRLILNFSYSVNSYKWETTPIFKLEDKVTSG